MTALQNYMRDAAHPKLRSELLRLYFDQGIAGVREHLNGVCPGCVADLVVAYVQSDSERLIESEFRDLEA